MSRHM